VPKGGKGGGGDGGGDGGNGGGGINLILAGCMYHLMRWRHVLL
jgi:hypothetical protein